MVESKFRQIIDGEPFDVVALDGFRLRVRSSDQRPVHDGYHRQPSVRACRIAKRIQLLEISRMKRRGRFQRGIRGLLQRMVGAQTASWKRPLAKKRLAHTLDQRHPQRGPHTVRSSVHPISIPGSLGRPQGEDDHGNAHLRRLFAPFRDISHDHCDLTASNSRQYELLRSHSVSLMVNMTISWVFHQSIIKIHHACNQRKRPRRGALNIYAITPWKINSRATSRYSFAVL